MDYAVDYALNYALKVKEALTRWMAGMDAADQVTMMAIGFGLMIFAVAALMIQRHRETKAQHPTRSTLVEERASYVIPGERHIAPAGKKKGDAFLRRLDHMA
ncbi:hypothetical protein [Celeribacter baekdonensis]|nr:hypothetical protein [Celeribacter baekdonensis]